MLTRTSVYLLIQDKLHDTNCLKLFHIQRYFRRLRENVLVSWADLPLQLLSQTCVGLTQVCNRLDPMDAYVLCGGCVAKLLLLTRVFVFT